MPCRRTSASETATVLPGRPCRVPWFVGRPCDAGHVEPTARMLEDIPRGNLRVPRSEFAAVWAEAERLCDEEKRGGPGGGWYAAGVAHTCRWIAGASVVFNFPHGPRTQPASAPITHLRTCPQGIDRGRDTGRGAMGTEEAQRFRRSPRLAGVRHRHIRVGLARIGCSSLGRSTRSGRRAPAQGPNVGKGRRPLASDPCSPMRSCSQS